MEPRTNREDVQQDVALAKVGVDIEYIKKAIERIDNRLTVMDKDYMRRSEVESLKRDGDAVHSDHEARIRFIERYMWLAIGALTLAQILVNYFK